MQSSPRTLKQPGTKNEADECSLSVNEFNKELMYRNTVLYGIKKTDPHTSTHPRPCAYTSSAVRMCG